MTAADPQGSGGAGDRRPYQKDYVAVRLLRGTIACMERSDPRRSTEGHAEAQTGQPVDERPTRPADEGTVASQTTSRSRSALATVAAWVFVVIGISTAVYTFVTAAAAGFPNGNVGWLFFVVLNPFTWAALWGVQYLWRPMGFVRWALWGVPLAAAALFLVIVFVGPTVAGPEVTATFTKGDCLRLPPSGPVPVDCSDPVGWRKFEVLEVTTPSGQCTGRTTDAIKVSETVYCLRPRK